MDGITTGIEDFQITRVRGRFRGAESRLLTGGLAHYWRGMGLFSGCCLFIPEGDIAG